MTRLGLALGCSVLAIAAGVAQQQQAPGGQGQPTAGGRGSFASRFTGTVTVGETKGMNMSRIRFEAGARTNWHVHTAGQLLLVEEGKGRLYEQGGQIVDIPAGRPVYTKAHVPHWHGAAPDSYAVQLSVYSGELKWMEPVTDDEYFGRKLR